MKDEADRPHWVPFWWHRDIGVLPFRVLRLGLGDFLLHHHHGAHAGLQGTHAQRVQLWRPKLFR